jgi:TatD DNase family protein
VIQRAWQNGLKAILCPTDISEPRELRIAQALIDNNPNIIMAAGIHPHNANKFQADMAKTLQELAARNKICAIGEIGLDFHYNISPPEDQIEVFRTQLNIAQELGLGVVVHSRKAAQDIAAAIEEEDFNQGGVLHCFTEDWEFAAHMLDRNFLVSFSGILTYPSAHSLREVAKKLPLKNILIETDSPYLVPVPQRGKVKRNEPCFVKEVARALSEIKKVTLEEIAQTTSDNFTSFFPLPDSGNP